MQRFVLTYYREEEIPRKFTNPPKVLSLKDAPSPIRSPQCVRFVANCRSFDEAPPQMIACACDGQRNKPLLPLCSFEHVLSHVM